MTAKITGIGFTVISKVSATPIQVTPALLNTGFTVIVAVWEAAELLTLVKDMPEPTPLAPIPILGIEEVQLYVV